MKAPETKVHEFLVRLAGMRVVLLFFFHAVVFWVAYVCAYLLRFEFAIPESYSSGFEQSLPIVVGVQLLAGALFGFYRGWWRYVGIHDVIRLVVGLTVAQAVLLFLWFIIPLFDVFSWLDGFSRGALVIDWAIALLLLFGARVGVRLLRDRTRPEATTEGTRRVLILGAGDAGESLAREIQHRPQLNMKVVGFLDDNAAKWNSHIRGIPILGPIEQVGRFVEDCDVAEVLIAMPSASGKRLREVVAQLNEVDVEFKTIPGVDRLVQGRVHVSQLRPVNLEDLIRRARVDLPGDPVRKLFEGKRVLVTGAGGTIGSELASQVLDFGPARLAILERSEFALYEVDKRLRKEKAWLMPLVSRHLVDIRDADALKRTMDTARPDIVLHAAAHKHVPLGEENPEEYVLNNTIATLRLGELCSSSNVERFVFISTDKAINPTSVMGATKRAAEIALLALAEELPMSITIVRFGNVLGSSGSVVPLFLEQIADGGPVTVTHPDVRRYFLRQSEAISLVLQAATLGLNRDILMLDMGEPIRIAELARDLIRLSGDDEIEIEFTGLRPGEKLHEEVRLDSETATPTVHPQIVVTRTPQPEAAVVRQSMDRLEVSCASNLGTCISILRNIIPEYAPAKNDRTTEAMPLFGLPVPKG